MGLVAIAPHPRLSVCASACACAPAVHRRALKSINYREEGEKFNVWVAYLNLENLHGNPPKVGTSPLQLFPSHFNPLPPPIVL